MVEAVDQPNTNYFVFSVWKSDLFKFDYLAANNGYEFRATKFTTPDTSFGAPVIHVASTGILTAAPRILTLGGNPNNALGLIYEWDLTTGTLLTSEMEISIGRQVHFQQNLDDDLIALAGWNRYTVTIHNQVGYALTKEYHLLYASNPWEINSRIGLVKGTDFLISLTSLAVI
jgi:hypothetical protein